MKTKQRLPLEGIRIVDFTWVAAGPRATRIFAFMGAEVIKVESIRRLDLNRGRPPFREGRSGFNASTGWAYFNAEKLSITLNMVQPKAQYIAKKLVAISDAVMDNMTGGVMERWHMNYEELIKIKPDIICLSMPVMGDRGPRKDYGAYGMGVEAISGIKTITGPPDQIPVGSGIAYPDSGPNPRHAICAFLAALHYRNKTGKGQRIEMAQYESTTAFSGTAILEYTTNLRLQPRLGNHIPHAAPHNCYHCQGDDRWCVIGVFTEKQWQALCQAIGYPTWCQEQRFATLADRKRNEAELDHLIQQWTMQHTPEEVLSILQKAGVPSGFVKDGQDLLENDPHLKARGFFSEHEHPEAGMCLLYPEEDAKLSAIPPRPHKPAPLLGEHNDYVFGNLLGMSEEEINQLIVEEVIY